MKKKLISTITTAVMISAVSIFSIISASAASYSINDVTDIQKHIAHSVILSDEKVQEYDLDNDGQLTVLDATIMQKQIAGIDVTDPTAKPAPQYIKLDKTSLNLETGNSYTLTVTADIENFEKSFLSSDPNVASVDDNGKVTALSSGSTVITVTAANGISAECNVTVEKAPDAISLDNTSTELKVGQNFTLTASAKNGATLKEMKWTSSNSQVAKIASTDSNTAEIQLMMQGTATITAETYNGKTANCNITVSGSVVKCIDISSWQGDSINFEQIKDSGIDYVIIRAGFGNLTSQKDKYFELNYKNAKAAGLKIGAYWYSYADSEADAKREAEACLTCIKGKTFDLPVYYDMEDESQTKFEKAELTKFATAFCEAIKDGGYSAGIYANLNWFRNYLDYDSLGKNYSIWLAQYYTTNGKDCDIWQYTDGGQVDGIYGNVDMSYIFNLNIIK